jgi:hypothetical protein
MTSSPEAGAPDNPQDLRALPRVQRVALLVKALNGAQRTNEALARCGDGEAMLDVLLSASQRLGLGLSRADLRDTPPIRDWIWWKNKEAVFTIGDAKPRYQQDGGQGRPPAAKADGGPSGGAPSDGAPSGGEEEGGPPRRKFLGLF